MSWRTYKFGDFLHRSKIPIDIEDGKEYKRVTIKTKHQGVSVRDTEKGKKIGTKKQFVLKAGQFVLSKIDARYGAFGIAPDEVEGAIITGNFWAYDVDLSIINIEWFNQFTNSQDFYDVCERASSGITHRKYLNEAFFLNYEIELPDVKEQLAIVEEFKKNKITLEDQSTELTHQLDLVKQLRQAFLREAMQGKLVPQNPNDEPASVLLEKIKAEKERLIKEKKIKKQKPLPPINKDEIPFEIEEGEKFVRLGDFFAIEKGKIGIKKAIPGNVPLVVTGEERLTHNEIHFSGAAVIVPLVSSTGHGHASLKRIHYQEGNFAVGNILGCIMPLLPDYFNMKFLFQYLDYYKEFFFVDKMKGAANVSLKISSISETPIPLIDKKIQDKYEELIKVCDELEASIKESQQQNELLLQQVLREALEPKSIEEKEEELAIAAEPQAKYEKGKVIALKPTNVDYYKRSVLAAEIVWQLHKEPTLGHLKLQKLIYLCQKTVDMQLPTNFLRQAMGPYDNRLMRSIDKQLKQKKWFEYQKDQVFKYQPLEKAGQHHKDFLKYFSEEREDIQFIIDKFKTIKSDIVEIVATLYACLDNMLNEKIIFSEALLLQRFYEWSEEKKKFSDKEVKRVFLSMKDTGIIPRGYNF